MDDIMPIRIQRKLFEEMVERSAGPDERLTLEWGEPDPEGFYTPTVYRHMTQRRDPEVLGCMIVVLIAFLLAVGLVIWNLWPR